MILISLRRRDMDMKHLLAGFATPPRSQGTNYRIPHMGGGRSTHIASIIREVNQLNDA